VGFRSPRTALVAFALAAAFAACGGQYGAEEDTSPPPGPGSDAAIDTSVALDANGVTDSQIADSGIDSNVGPQFAVLATGLDDPGAVAADSQYVYYSSGRQQEVRRCARTGCGASPELVASGQSVLSGLTVAASTVFWATGYRYISKCATGVLMPCTPSTFNDSGVSSFPAHPVAFGTRLYWVTQNGATKSIVTCPLSGCSMGYPKAIYVSTPGDNVHNTSTIGLALDGIYLYIARYTGGIVRFKMPTAESLDGASSKILTSTGFATSSLELDGQNLRWAVSSTGRIEQCAAPECTMVAPFLTMRERPQATISDTQYVFGSEQGKTTDAGAAPPFGGVLWRRAK
jgi:hypothetical protein